MARYRSLQADNSQRVVLRIVRLQFHVYGRRTNKQENIFKENLFLVFHFLISPISASNVTHKCNTLHNISPK